MQTPREVIDALMRGRPAERVGLYDSAWKQTLEAWTKQGYPVNEKGEPVDQAEYFGYDMVGCGGWFDVLPRRGFSEIVEETDEWKVVRNGAGACLKWWKTRAGTPEHVDFHMTSRDVWEKEYRPRLLALDRERLDVKDAKGRLERQRERKLWTSFGNLFIWENMRQSMGDICLYESMLLDPDWIRDYGRVYTDFFKMHWRVLFEEAGRPDGMWMCEDLGYKNATFCSPGTYAELIFPYFREMVEFFHSYDVRVILHTCGFTEPLLDMILAAGFDALNPMEVKAGNDPLRIARKVDGRLCLIGGLDARILETHDRALIRRETAALVNGMKSLGARFVFASDHSISTNVDLDDFRAALDACRENAAY